MLMKSRNVDDVLQDTVPRYFQHENHDGPKQLEAPSRTTGSTSRSELNDDHAEDDDDDDDDDMLLEMLFKQKHEERSSRTMHGAEERRHSDDPSEPSAHSKGKRKKTKSLDFKF